jgi:hypothetical protein
VAAKDGGGVMALKKLSPNARCPCGTGRKYKSCCFDKGFHYLVDEDGTIVRSVPLHPEVAARLPELKRDFMEKHGRPMGPDDLLFGPEDPEKLLEFQAKVVQVMREDGIAPSLIYAFEKTGILLTDDNRHMMPTSHIEEFEAAVEEYLATHPRDGLDS